jgi:hypothetical protein
LNVDALRGGAIRVVREVVASASLRRKLIRRLQKDQWDKQIEEDLEDGTLDNLIEEAREDHRKGRTKPLP